MFVITLGNEAGYYMLPSYFGKFLPSKEVANNFS